MTDEQRARSLVEAEPCNYGGPGDDKAEMDWRASMDKILAAFAAVRADEQKNVRHMLEYADAMVTAAQWMQDVCTHEAEPDYCDGCLCERQRKRNDAVEAYIKVRGVR